MPFTRALYYPSIDIKDETWLKNAMLYWEKIQTIVPSAMEFQYSTQTARKFHEADLLTPFYADLNRTIIDELTDCVMDYLQTPEGVEVIVPYEVESPYESWYSISGLHQKELPIEIQRLVKIHRDKLPDEIKRKIKNDDWIGVNSLFADFYLTLLATHISENIGAALLTNVAAPNKLGTQVKLDAQSNSLINASTSRKRPVNLAQGTLADVIFKNIQIDDNTQVDDILEFRDRHKCELGRFRTRIAKLTDTIQGYQSLTELRQHAEDIYTCQVAPAIASLKEGLEDCRIDYRWNGFLNVTAIGTSLHEFIGIPCHQALLAGSGISFVVSTILYTREKARILRDNPYSYLLAVNEEFGK